MIKLNVEIMFDTDKEYNGDLIDNLNELLNEESDVKVYVKEDVKWQKLKEWVSFTQPKNINDEFISGACAAYSYVKDKMRELEAEDEEN